MRSAGAITVAALLCVATWYYALKIVPRYQLAEQKQTGEPRARIISDLYPRWVGTRELLLYRADPYSPQVTQRIQSGLYGSAVDLSKVRDQQGFAYPVYVALLLAPFVHMSFATVAATFAALLFVWVIATAWLWSRLIEPRWRRTTLAAVVLLVCASLASVQGVQLQNLSLLVAFLISAAIAAIRSNRMVLAGVLLAVATIKPQLVFPLVGWIALWTTGEWHRRFRVLPSFLITLAALVLLGELMLRGWVKAFLRALSYYRSYNAPSILTILFGGIGGTAATIILIAGVTIVCWRHHKTPAASVEFYSSSALVLAATLVGVPTVSLYNQILLLPAFLLFATQRRWWLHDRGSRTLWRVAWLLIALPWVLILCLLAMHAAGANLTGTVLVPLPYYTQIATPILCTLLLVIGILRPSRNAVT